MFRFEIFILFTFLSNCILTLNESEKYRDLEICNNVEYNIEICNNIEYKNKCIKLRN